MHRSKIRTKASLPWLILSGLLIGPSLAQSSTKVRSAKAAVLMIMNGAELYRESHGAWPTSIDELIRTRCLLHPIEDPWGRPYRLTQVGEVFVIHSDGENPAVPDDDIELRTDGGKTWGETPPDPWWQGCMS